LFAEESVRIDGQGGWRGDPVVFDEQLSRSDDDVFDEAILRVDLNDDGDLFDRVKTPDVTGCPVIPVGRGLYNLDIDNDGVFTRAILGGDYLAFFLQNGFMPPALVYVEGTILGGAIHIAGQCVTTYDPDLESSSPPIGFGIDADPIFAGGVHSWREITPPQ
jgi:hypothetical protein